MDRSDQNRLFNVTAAILAGGLGTRLKSTVPDRPKALAPIHGRPFLSYLLNQIVKSGIGQAVLCTGIGAEQIEKTFGTQFGNLPLVYSRESSPAGTAGALREALPFLNFEWILVFNGDSFVDVDLNAFWIWHHDKKANASIVLAHVPDTARFGCIERNEEDAILRFAEKDGLATPGWINAGVYLLNRTTIANIPSGGAVSLEREVFPTLTGGLFGYPGARRFLDIGTPESYAAAEEFFTVQPGND